MKFKKITAAVAVALGLSVMTACSSVSTSPDEQALHYKGGSFSSKSYESCIDPSTREFNGPGDDHFVYPAGQRTYSFTGRKGSESKAIKVKTQDSQQLSVKGFVTIELTNDCKLLRKFHEAIGSKYKAYEPGGWLNLLNDYVAVPLNSTMDKAALAYPWRTLYSSSDALTEFENAVKENLPAEVKTAMGDSFITVKAVSLETPEPDKELLDGLKASEKAKLDNAAQKERNEKLRTQYDSFKDCRKAMSEESCLVLKLAEDGDVPFYPIPAGGSINVTK